MFKNNKNIVKVKNYIIYFCINDNYYSLLLMLNKN